MSMVLYYEGKIDYVFLNKNYLVIYIIKRGKKNSWNNLMRDRKVKLCGFIIKLCIFKL